MGIQVPEPPTGVGDLNSQPGLASDEELQRLAEVIEEGLSGDVFDRLTQYVPSEEVPAERSEEYRERALEYVRECISVREELRPQSLRELDELPAGVGRTTAGAWVWYSGSVDGVEHDVVESEADTFEHGKYLFFAPEDPRLLEDIVLEQFQKRPFRSAKIPTIPAKRDDWVLCLYDDDNRYWYDLREAYHDPPQVRFRGFKTDAATRQGEYSERFQKS